MLKFNVLLVSITLKHTEKASCTVRFLCVVSNIKMKKNYFLICLLATILSPSGQGDKIVLPKDLWKIYASERNSGTVCNVWAKVNGNFLKSLYKS